MEHIPSTPQFWRVRKPKYALNSARRLDYARLKMLKADIPPFNDLLNPILQALRDLGGSGTIGEINSKVAEISRLSDDQLEVLHNAERGGQTEVEYQLAWARTYLKIYGLIDNSSRGVWELTAKGKQCEQVDPALVTRFVRAQRTEKAETASIWFAQVYDDELSWRNELLETLFSMEPAAFERLVQRLLRESGFTQVEVTGKSSNGGINGKGILRLGGLLNFHVIFQCKRYQGSVNVSQVRDFRGAMVGRADKGLLITTGNFTQDAIREATRDGALVIDLVDGDELLNKLKELGLGVKTERVEMERVTIDHDWFLVV